MAHFAEIDENNIVTRVLVVNNDILLDENDNEIEQKGIEFLQSIFSGSNWVQGSYNGNFRKYFPEIDYIWDADNDVFYGPQPFNSWTLDTGSFLWESPVTYPSGSVTGSYTGSYQWDEDIYNEDTNDPKILGWVTSSIS